MTPYTLPEPEPECHKDEQFRAWYMAKPKPQIEPSLSQQMHEMRLCLDTWDDAYAAGAASRDGEVARLKTVPMKYRRMAFNAELQQENGKLRTEIEALRADAARYQAPVAQIKDVDEYGPRLDWFKHWTTFPEGTKLYVHAQGDPV